MYGVLVGENAAFIERAEVTRFLLDTDGPNLPVSLSLLFKEGDVSLNSLFVRLSLITGEKVNFEQFSAWLEKHNEVRLRNVEPEP